MLCNVPIVDRTVGVASREDQYVAIGVFDIGLAVVDIILVQGLFGHHLSVCVKLCSIEKDRATTESIRADSGGFRFAESRVEGALEFPGAICLLFENQRNIVEPTTDVSVLTDKAACQDRVSIVNDALGLWFSLASDNFSCEFSEMNFTVVRGKSESSSRW